MRKAAVCILSTYANSDSLLPFTFRRLTPLATPRSLPTLVRSCCVRPSLISFRFFPSNFSRLHFSFAARFSPHDQYSRHRVQLKKRFNILPSNPDRE